MGSYDIVLTDLILPDGLEGKGIRFQTKDFDNLFESYTITDKYLVLEKYFRDSPQIIQVNYTGDICFYYCTPDKTYGYRAVFSKGILLEIRSETVWWENGY